MFPSSLFLVTCANRVQTQYLGRGGQTGDISTLMILEPPTSYHHCLASSKPSFSSLRLPNVPLVRVSNGEKRTIYFLGRKPVWLLGGNNDIHEDQ